MELTVSQRNHNVDEQVLQDINSAFKTDEGVHQEDHEIPARNVERNNGGEPQRKNNNIVVILIAIFMTYSAIVSTIALIVALKNSPPTLSSSTNSCDCAFDSFSLQKDSIPSGFCALVDQCPETLYPTISTSLPTTNATPKPSDLPTSKPSKTPTVRPSDFPTVRPSDLPTAKPSANPTKNPSDSPTFRPTEAPTSKPSESPTLRPTEAPTYEYDLYHYYVGDYKTSAQNASHSAWLLCDGSYVDSQDYGDLFEVIGHSFGAFPGYPSLFQLPDAQNRIQGIIGSNHTMGDVVGNEQMQLNETQLPSHYHYVAAHSDCNGKGPSGNLYISSSCWNAAYMYPYSDVDYGKYHLTLVPSTPTFGQTSVSGSNETINVMQPTIYTGNVFIYSGVI
eukprot:324330_1